MTGAEQRDWRVDDFDYVLPPELIAQEPLAERDAARLLVLSRATGAIQHRGIRDLPELLLPGDLLVANNTRVLPARLHALKQETGARVEFLLLRHDGGGTWEALAKPARKLAGGTRLTLLTRDGEPDPLAVVEVVARGEEGAVTIRFPNGEPQLGLYGEAPLPPYIRARLADEERYQTTYAKIAGSAAAPTAGLHFTQDLRQKVADRGVGWAEVTLHVGLDTFRPVTAERVADHVIHREWCDVPEETAKAIAATRRAGGRVIAVGTTSARTLEVLGRHWDDEAPKGYSGWADIFITPGYRWRLVDGLLTNFHLPRSTLVMMVSALAGPEAILAAYREAIERRYRFFSFGDAMLIA